MWTKPYKQELHQLADNLRAQAATVRAEEPRDSAAILKCRWRYDEATRLERLAASDAPRRVVLDTETTGLEPSEGHRIIELAALELIGLEPTGRMVVQRFNPGADCHWSPAAEAVHGIRREELDGCPEFAGDVAGALLEWLDGAEVVAHHAQFDMGHFRAEIARAFGPEFGAVVVDAVFPRVICTRALAREVLPDLPSARLDALCDHFGVDRSERAGRHSAEVDVKLLAQVYPCLVALQEAQQ